MQEINVSFRLNGLSYSREELYDWIKLHVTDSNEFLQNSADFLQQWFNEEATVLVQTSGTTGVPKIIEIDKSAMLASARATGTFFELQQGTKALCCLPTKYIAGKMMLVRALALGWELDIVAPSSRPLQDLDKTYDFVAMVPLQVSASLSDLHKVQKLLIGGAAVDSALSSKLLTQNIEAYESYSMTETVTHIALKRIGESFFKTLPNVKLMQDARGCLVIDAPFVNPEKLVTNDVVELLSEHTFIWKGRADNVVNSGGVKLFPELIEDKLRNSIAARFFCAGLADEKLGERLVLIIEGEAYTVDDSIFLQLEKYERPKEIYFVTSFEQTETGKTRRKLILENIRLS